MAEPPLDPKLELGLERGQLPRHIAIIMDGNGRWANLRNMPRIHGHAEGAAVVHQITEHCARLKLDALTLYSFSTENWKRPKPEIDALMDLYVEHLIKERELMMDNGVRLVQIGHRQGLPEAVLRELDITREMTSANTGLTLCLAINYGARQELVDAIRRIARRVQTGELSPEEIEMHHVDDSLDTAGLPDPDLLIRTAGEMRISNFLLWQISYSEIYVTETLWPDFHTDDLNEALRSYAARDRRFGAVKTDIAPPA